ncbi:LPS assembly lipoprotein LptE, partial [Planctomycetota bacterium]
MNGYLHHAENGQTQTVLRCLNILLLCAIFLGINSCSGGYQQSSLHPTDVKSVRLEMFDNRSFRRNMEYALSDALAKRIESETPYKVITNADVADTVISGQITMITETLLSTELETG